MLPRQRGLVWVKSIGLLSVNQILLQKMVFLLNV
jgi:hypothetical protein